MPKGDVSLTANAAAASSSGEVTVQGGVANILAGEVGLNLKEGTEAVGYLFQGFAEAAAAVIGLGSDMPQALPTQNQQQALCGTPESAPCRR